MPTTVNLSVGSGETKDLTFNCGGTFVPDDIQFVITGSGGDTNTTLSGIAYCSTGASTVAKEVTMPGFALESGQRIILYLSTTNSKANATLNVNSTGAKTIKIGGANTTTSNFISGYWVCEYDGTNWNLSRLFADVKQDDTTTSSYRKVILSGNTYSSAGTAVSSTTGQTYATQYVEVQPSTGKIRSKGFVKASPTNTTGILLADGTDIAQSTFATSGHTHTASLTSGGTSTISLAANTTYTLTAGGSSVIFKTPPDNNNNTVTTGKSGVVLSTSGVAVVTKDGSDSGTVALPSNIPSTWLGNTATTAAAGNHTHGYSTVSGTNDGTNWTSLTINGVTKNIPSGGGGSSNSYSGIAYCNTAANTLAKEATYPNFVLQNGQRIILYMAVANTNTTGTGCTLNVNGTGAKPMRMESYVGSGSWSGVWGPQPSKGYYLCEYDGTYWKMAKINTSSGMGMCTTAANVTKKTIDIDGFSLSQGVSMLMILINSNTASDATLSVSGTGTYTIKMGGAYNTNSTNFPAGAYFCNFDGTYWNVKQLTSNSGSGGGVSYLSDLTDVESSPITGNVLQFNGTIWTGGIAVTNVVAGSGLNVTSGDTTTDGGQIGYLDASETISSTGTIHLTRVNTSSSYNGTAKPGFGPSENKTVTSSSNTFYVPYYQVDKFGRVTGSATRTITINGLGGSGGGSSVSANGGESMNMGYIAGKVIVDNVYTNFIVPPARSNVGSGSDDTLQGLVRPIIEYDMTYNDYEFDYGLSGTSVNSDLENLTIFTNPLNPSSGKQIALIPIVTVYYKNAFNSRMEAAPFLALDLDTASSIGLLKGYEKYFSPKIK